MNRWYALFLTLLFLGIPWLWITRPPVNAPIPGTTIPQPAINYLAPDFSLKTLAGDDFSLAAVRGTPVVLNFWATWCGPCQRELPALQKAAQEYAGQVHIIAVDQAEPPATVQKYVDELGLTFTIPLDSNSAIATRYNVKGMPTTFFIDAEGVIRDIHVGEMNSITLAEQIAEISS